MKQIRHPRLRLFALVAALTLFASACGSETHVDTGSPSTIDGDTPTREGPTRPDLATGEPRTRLESARALWATAGPDSYAMTVQLRCNCDQIQSKNIVVDGRVESTENVGEDTVHEPRAQAMEGLFDEVDLAIREGYFWLDMEFDAETGALLNYWVDLEETVADEEHGVYITVSWIEEDVTATTVASEPLVVLAEAIAAIEDDYGCGYGFSKGNAAQTLALVVFHTGDYSESGPDLSSPVELPNDDWMAEVRMGSDLFANWCLDVVEEGAPVPEIDEVWTVVAGTLTAEVDSPNVVKGLLADVVIESPSGERVEVAEIALLNTGYGFFAG